MLRGRNYVLPEDMADLASDVLRHRVALSYEALSEGLDADAAARQLLGAKQPSQAFVTVEQVAALAGFLASEQAAQVRGAHWNMDGGFAAA